MNSLGLAPIPYDWHPLKRGYYDTEAHTENVKTFYHVKTQGENGHLQFKERGFRRNQHWWQLGSQNSANRIVENKFSLF